MTTAPYAPQQNRIAERNNWTLKDKMSVMLVCSGLPDNMWEKAIFSICHVLNKMPHKKLDKTPYEIWNGRAPNLKYLEVWGCLAKIGILDPQRIKIGPRPVDSIFIRYGHNGATYRFILIHESGVFGAIHESRGTEFF